MENNRRREMNDRCVALGTLIALVALTAHVRAEVKTIRVPQGGEVPEVAVDGRGVLHLTYGLGKPGNGFYVQSGDAGRTFSAPVQLNRRADRVTVGGERGPKVALGKDGVIHVIWLGYYKKGGGVWYTRSTDGGK